MHLIERQVGFSSLQSSLSGWDAQMEDTEEEDGLQLTQESIKSSRFKMRFSSVLSFRHFLTPLTHRKRFSQKCSMGLFLDDFKRLQR